MALPVHFYTGTYDEYKALEGFASNALYFCTDIKVIFRGDEVIPVPYVVIADGELPTENLLEGLFYVDTQRNLLYIYKNGELTTIFGEGLLFESKFQTELNKISWDDQTRTIILPKWDGEKYTEVTIDLGQDLIIDQASTYYDSNTREIVLGFKTMDTTDGTEDITLVKIKVDDLIDIYQGSQTNSIKVEVAAATDENSVDARTISANLLLHTSIENEKPNALIIKEDGAYVDVETYTDNRIGDIGEFETVAAMITHAQATADLGVQKADAAQATADSKVPLTRIITSTGKTLEKDITLSYGDIDGAAPIESPNFTGVPTTPTIAQSIDWTVEENANTIASITYVHEAIIEQDTWGAAKRRNTWGGIAGRL